jgi:hypothetical protein
MDRLRSLARRRVAGVLLSVLVCASVTGCGSGRGEVTGVVRCNGKPLPFGTIQFLGEDGVPHAAAIQPDGTFCVEMPAGEAKVIVSCVDEERLSRFTSQRAAAAHGSDPVGARRTGPSGQGAARPPVSSGNFSLIPQRYADWDASGLMVLVKRGKTVQDFDLTSH